MQKKLKAITPFSLRMVQGMVDIRHGTNDISKRQVIQTPTHVGDLMVESASNDGDANPSSCLPDADSAAASGIRKPANPQAYASPTPLKPARARSILLKLSQAPPCTLGAPGIRWDLVQQLGDMFLDLMGSVDTASPPGHAMPTLDTLGWDRPELPLYLYLCS
ncbi:hypothetical protein B0H13DRAFT_2262494 [Mycena leptocephala]|nr:hypothetical protein B0H13DRAFT_2264224 [Mycena leptocephala]KAJ7934831.1 hypothetical protein B0H13DRAFT_2262494 [Mycena leptocephala]